MKQESFERRDSERREQDNARASNEARELRTKKFLRGESKRARESGREQKRGCARERFNFQTTAISRKLFHRSRRFHRSIIDRSQNEVFADRRSIDRCTKIRSATRS